MELRGASEISRAREWKAAPLVPRALAALVFALAAVAWLAPAARASGNASAAAGFIESAQNRDGGFGEKRGAGSEPDASLWAATALLAAGKNPGDEFVTGGSSLDEYLQSHVSAYTSLTDLGLLAIVHSAAAGSSPYGDPAAKLESRLTESAAPRDPAGAALGILGLLAVNTSGARQVATAATQALLASPTSDGGWGPEGLSDSASTALVLQALAASGAASAHTHAVQGAVAYLQRAQANDGSIAASIRTDQAIAGGSVTATAFTIQALGALGLAPLRTPNGKTVLQGLEQYQQQSTGGLTSNGSLYSEVPPSVAETAEAFAAFDGINYPLATVPRSTAGPGKGSSAKPTSSHVSAGSASQGLSGATGTTDKGAFRQATATSGSATASRTGKIGSARKGSAKQAPSSAQGGGTSVSGEVVGSSKPARLVAVAGQKPEALSAAERATLALVALLVACTLLGGYMDARRPRQDGRSLAAVSVAAVADFYTAARARGSLVPFALLLVSVALVVVPFATGMFDRAPKGARMVTAFEPYMQPARLASYRRDIAQLNEGFTQAAASGPKLLAPHATVAVAEQHFQVANPQLTQVEQQWPQANTTLDGLLATIQANRTNYEAVAALPSFSLFPWFFIVPGAILVLLASTALIVPSTWSVARWAVVVLGVGLVLAPVVFGMWERAPQGAAMISAFRTVETRTLVTKVQNDFATVTTGEGALGGELAPALEARGLSTTQIQRALPAVARVEGDWVQILQSITPLIGVMSDNVVNFQAVAALPPFGLFPWLFVIPGLAVVALVLLSSTGPRRLDLRRVQPADAQAAT